MSINTTTKKEDIRLHDRDFKLMISAEEVDARIKALAKEMSDSLAESDPMIIVVLNGAFLFAADLVRALSFDPEVQFVKVKSYDGLQSTGKVDMQLPFTKEEIAGRNIVVIEDIIETGLTLEKLCGRLKADGATEIRIATLLLKPNCLKADINIDYSGFDIGDEFVVGYGMDYNQRGRTHGAVYCITDAS